MCKDRPAVVDPFVSVTLCSWLTILATIFRYASAPYSNTVVWLPEDIGPEIDVPAVFVLKLAIGNRNITLVN